jgi:hypothetical protein
MYSLYRGYFESEMYSVNGPDPQKSITYMHHPKWDQLNMCCCLAIPDWKDAGENIPNDIQRPCSDA